MTVSFALADETVRLRDELRAWAVNDVRPLAREADRTKRYPGEAAKVLARCPIDVSPLALAEMRELEKRTDTELVASFDDEGSHVLGCVLMEMIVYGDPWPLGLQKGAGIAQKVVPILGTPQQVERWVGGLNRGDYTGAAFALTEPHFGSDVSQVATTAVRDGDCWRINGTKIYCSGGALADFVVVFATIDKTLGRRGIRAFIVERGTPGFTVVKANEEKLGLRCQDTATLAFDDVLVPADQLLGDASHDGFEGALQTLTNSRPYVGAMAIGIGQASLDYARAWLSERRGEFTARRWDRIQDELARLDHALDEARGVVLKAAWLRDRGRPNRKEASMAKAYAPPIAEQACLRAVQLMGPEGCSQLHLVEKWYRDVKIYDIWEGSGQIQRITISRQLLGSSSSRA